MAAPFELTHLIGVAVLAGERGGGGGDLEPVVFDGRLSGTHLVTVEAGHPGARVRAHLELRHHRPGLVAVAVRALAARPDLLGERPATRGRAWWSSTAPATSTPATPTTATRSRKRMPAKAMRSAVVRTSRLG